MPSGTAGGSGSEGLPGDSLHPAVAIDTSLGRITVRLDREKAPISVDNFLAYVESGHYDGTIIHQVIKDYPKVILGGAFTPEKSEKANARMPIYNEARKALKNRRGTVAMARRPDDQHSATCHFFVNLADNESLDYNDETVEGYGYCAFGEIIDGIEVADKIAQVEVEDTDDFEQIPIRTVMIESIHRLR